MPALHSVLWFLSVIAFATDDEKLQKLYLIMWTNYKHLCNSVVGQKFKASSDVISVTIATGQLNKKDL